MRQTHQWTENELEVVRRDYEGNTASAQRIADKLGVSLFAVKGQIQKLGVAKITDRQRWDPSQDERLRELLETYPPTQVAKRMGRSIHSVTVRSRRLGISRRDRSGWYSKGEVCAILGVDHKWVQARIDAGTLSAKSYFGGPVQQLGASCWKIQRKELREFIRRYPEELNGRNVDLITLVDILAGLHS